MSALDLAMGFRAARGALGLALGVLSSFGCAGQPPPSATPPEPREKSLPADFSTTPFGVVHVASVPADVPLPDVHGWRALTSGSFVRFEHAASASSFTLRVWRAARLVRPAQCEAEARLARPSLPELEPQSLLEERALTTPAGFDVRLRVAAFPGKSSSIRGAALAVGAGIGRCYVAAFETEADGPLAAELIANRLDAMVEGTFAGVRLANAEERVPPPPGVK